MSRPRAHPKRRWVGPVQLGTRQVAALVVGRHANVVSRHCVPIACDVKSKLPLYDLDEVYETLRGVPERFSERRCLTRSKVLG